MAGLRDRLIEAARTLLGASVYEQPPPPGALSLDDEHVARLRSMTGGMLQPAVVSKTRWYLADLEAAQRSADAGDLTLVGQLCRSWRRDGMIGGLESTRTAGLVALPKRWRGDQQIISTLQADNGSRSVFDEMFPSAELARLAADGIGCGVGVAELVPVRNRAYPVMVTLEPQFLRWRQSEGRWYFNSTAGALPITPGDGRWILHTPGGRLNPWLGGAWPALGRAFIDKEHALLNRANFSGKLANPARVAYAPNAATEDQRIGFLSRLIAWGINTVFELPPGWEVKLLESNGRGWEVFGKQIETSDLEAMITLAGQVVTVTGGTGFANADIHKTIRADLIKETGEALADTINTQGLPFYAISVGGIDALDDSPRVEWDTAPPEDRKAEANALEGCAKAVTELKSALDGIKDPQTGKQLMVDAKAIADRFGVPLIEADETVTEPPSDGSAADDSKADEPPPKAA